jgi:adenylate cyclase
MTLPSVGVAAGQPTQPESELVVILTHDRRTVRCREGEHVLIGRSEECDIVLEKPWVSRRHAEVAVRGGRAIVQDRSAAGTFVATAGGHAFLLRRESFVLSGEGSISPCVQASNSEAQPVFFEVMQRSI